MAKLVAFVKYINAYPGVNSFGHGRMEALASHPTVKPVTLIDARQKQLNSKRVKAAIQKGVVKAVGLSGRSCKISFNRRCL